VPVYEVLGRRDWDSKRNRTPVSSYRRGDTMESDIREGFAYRLAGKTVQHIRGSVEHIYPIANWK
jgi:hypothetical protein